MPIVGDMLKSTKTPKVLYTLDQEKSRPRIFQPWFMKAGFRKKRKKKKKRKRHESRQCRHMPKNLHWKNQGNKENSRNEGMLAKSAGSLPCTKPQRWFRNVQRDPNGRRKIQQSSRFPNPYSEAARIRVISRSIVRQIAGSRLCGLETQSAMQHRD